MGKKKGFRRIIKKQSFTRIKVSKSISYRGKKYTFKNVEAKQAYQSYSEHWSKLSRSGAKFKRSKWTPEKFERIRSQLISEGYEEARTGANIAEANVKYSGKTYNAMKKIVRNLPIAENITKENIGAYVNQYLKMLNDEDRDEELDNLGYA